MKSKLRIALVGCGQIADGHVTEIAKIDSAEMVAVCDSEPIMAEQLAMRFSIPKWYNDFGSMLAVEKPDVVHICTPPSSHALLAKLSVDAGCHVYIEKPFALNYGETDELLKYLESRGKKFTIGHNSEFDPPSEDMRSFVEKGELGDAVHVESWFGYSLAGSFGKAILSSPDHWVHYLPGKLFHNNINHMLNKITEYIHDEKPYVHAIAWKSGETSTYGDVRDDLSDELRVLIKGKSVSAYGTFTSSVKPVAQFVRVYGTKTSLTLDYISRTVVVDQGVKYPSGIGRLLAGYAQSLGYFRSALINTKKFLKNDYHYFAGLHLLISKFYSSILEDKQPPISPTKIRQIAWIMDEIFRQTGKNR
ncbi:MAG: Gfo/Idh/MocA family protein [Desulfuromonadaceae bacterium]